MRRLEEWLSRLFSFLGNGYDRTRLIGWLPLFLLIPSPACGGGLGWGGASVSELLFGSLRAFALGWQHRCVECGFARRATYFSLLVQRESKQKKHTLGLRQRCALVPSGAHPKGRCGTRHEAEAAQTVLAQKIPFGLRSSAWPRGPNVLCLWHSHALCYSLRSEGTALRAATGFASPASRGDVATRQRGCRYERSECLDVGTLRSR